jgi:CMP-N,N'-diacetyllegionaminic acid synthase
MNICTVIPARGGSKSIPKKNIKLLRGKPLIQYSIEYSLNCSLISHTVVSTDSDEIAEISKSCCAEVPFMRPGELAGDDVPDYPVMRYMLDKLEHLYKKRIDIVVLLRPTSPLRPPALIEQGVDLLSRFSKASSIRSVTPSTEHPYRQWKIDGNYMSGYESNAQEPYNLPRQKLPSVYFQTGDLEIIRRDTLLKGSVSGDHILPLIVRPQDIVDIDDMSDWEKADKRLRENKT